ncbi:hypothetical protein FHS09_002632 [Microbulbifer rhizosphaerae]|uniref:Uncharacterized protein n=1 Tax=Microbulbifer rhizosphaerae TaxID=1562603 RepID=A0A7W4WDL9_9GAMM|nr:hypothetical protein [Microbulbifer rhizosphaerae]
MTKQLIVGLPGRGLPVTTSIPQPYTATATCTRRKAGVTRLLLDNPPPFVGAIDFI